MTSLLKRAIPRWLCTFLTRSVQRHGIGPLNVGIMSEEELNDEDSEDDDDLEDDDEDDSGN